MKAPRWAAITELAFSWEREALEFLRAHLPDYEPWRAWSNLEFVDDEGRVNEVDALVLTPQGLALVEIKSRPGAVVVQIQGSSYRLRQHAELLPERVRSKAINALPTPQQTPRRRGRPPKTGYGHATALAMYTRS